MPASIDPRDSSILDGGGFSADIDQLRIHARTIEEIGDRFGAVRAASAHIVGGTEAYGLLCSWIPLILLRRHERQEALFAYVEENFALVADGLRQAGRQYEEVETRTVDMINDIIRDLPDAR